MCFSLNNPLSFDHLSEKWLVCTLTYSLFLSLYIFPQIGLTLLFAIGSQPEIKHHAPGKGFVLLGMKSDLECKVADEQVDEIMKTCGADAYIKVSAKTKHNVDEVFQIAMRAFFKPKEVKKTRKCTIL